MLKMPVAVVDGGVIHVLRFEHILVSGQADLVGGSLQAIASDAYSGRRHLPPAGTLAVHLPQRAAYRPRPRRSIPRARLRPQGLNAYYKVPIARDFYGHGWVRTSDFSRVKRALSH